MAWHDSPSLNNSESHKINFNCYISHEYLFIQSVHQGSKQYHIRKLTYFFILTY